MATTKAIHLNLDYDCILSAWNGNIFSDDAAVVSDNITLDLTTFENAVAPPCLKMEQPVELATGPIFSAAEMGLSYLPAVKNEPNSSNNWGVVPGGAASDTESGGNDLKVPSIAPTVEQKAGQEFVSAFASAPSPSLSSCSSDLGVVPDISPTAATASNSNNNSSNTATSNLCRVPSITQSFPILPSASLPFPAGMPPAFNLGINGLHPSATSLPSKPFGIQTTAAAPEIRSRKECLQRYREKKARRLYTKKIRYQLRKINADKRPRIKGRFVKKEELEEYMKLNPDNDCSAEEEEEDDVCMSDSDDDC